MRPYKDWPGSKKFRKPHKQKSRIPSFELKRNHMSKAVSFTTNKRDIIERSSCGSRSDKGLGKDIIRDVSLIRALESFLGPSIVA